MEELQKKYTKEQTDKAIELYSEWKADKGANPRSDFNSMQWALREIEKTAPITKSGRRLTAVQESGCDEVSEETLANLPFQCQMAQTQKQCHLALELFTTRGVQHERTKTN